MELDYTLPLYTGLLVLVGLIRLAELRLSRRNRACCAPTGGGGARAHFRAMVLLHIGILVGAGVEAWVTGVRPCRARVGHAGPDVGRERLALVGDRHSRPHWNVASWIPLRNRQPVPQYDGCIQWPIPLDPPPNYVAVFLELLALP